MTEAAKETLQHRPALAEVLATKVTLDAERLFYLGLILFALFTRFYDLESRVMSHDESLHTYFSYQLAEGRGFQHTPLMHGPLQFHLVALSYFLFGDTDATARFPAAVAGVLAVGLVWLFRRWIGRWGAAAAATLMAISPYMLYYSRYVRNEALVVPLALLTVYGVFRYVETRQARYLYLFAAALSLHYTAKETAYIYTAQLMLFLGAVLTGQLLRRTWGQTGRKVGFALGLAAFALGSGLTLVELFRSGAVSVPGTGLTVQPLNPTEAPVTGGPFLTALGIMGLLLAAVGLLVAAGAAVAEFRNRLRTDFPALDLLVVSTTFVLPQLAALPANALGWDPLAYQDLEARARTTVVVLVLSAIALGLGLVWNWRRWAVAAGIYFGIFTVFYTTIFTNPFGLFTGLVGSLGYWLEQQGVHRGSQPWYYYLLVQVPVYEYLPALASLAAGGYALRDWARGRSREEATETAPSEAEEPRFPTLPFIGFWTVTALLAFTMAGERMPWLTVHIALPMILLGGWALGRFLQGVPWRAFLGGLDWGQVALLLVLALATLRALGYLLGPVPPFAGAELSQLQVTTGFLISAMVAVLSAVGLVALRQSGPRLSPGKAAGLIVWGLLAVLTVRTAFRATYINYDNATEFMVYAHSATGVKAVLRQAEELSIRTTDGLNIEIGYDDDVSWPFSWYLRHFRNARFYAAAPSRDLLNYPLIIAGDDNWDKVESILGDRYYKFEYIRMWWPMQDYFGLTGERIREALTSADYRAALWDIWFNRDFTRYGELTGRDFSLQNWSPSDRMRLYIRKDMAALLWDYGVSVESALEPVEDPYAGRMIDLSAAAMLTGSADGTVTFNRPRDLAVAPDGTLYVADTFNHRIVHLSPEGQLLHVWGSFGQTTEEGPAPPGTFNEPWGIAVGPDGTVYVADTWNHRVQVFAPDGRFLRSFGFFGTDGSPEAYWGPRDVAVDGEGRLFVADTGNKRVVVFDAEGNFLTAFGAPGALLGDLDEPVGLALDAEGRVYVADTWNQRIQVFTPVGEGGYEPLLSWPIDGWFGQSLDNKPYLAVNAEGVVCASDPEGFRVLCFDREGTFVLGWGLFGVGPEGLNLPTGLAFDAEGGLWVADSGNNRVVRFLSDFSQPPEQSPVE